MDQLLPEFTRIEIGSLGLLRGLLRWAAIGLGMALGGLVLLLFWSVAALDGFQEAIARRVPSVHGRYGRGNH